MIDNLFQLIGIGTVTVVSILLAREFIIIGFHKTLQTIGIKRRR